MDGCNVGDGVIGRAPDGDGGRRATRELRRAQRVELNISNAKAPKKKVGANK